MYRLLKFKTSRSHSLTRLSSLEYETNIGENSCRFCWLLQNNLCTSRSQSTIVKPSPMVNQKPRKKRSKKFSTTELLAVSPKSTLQCTAKVQTANLYDLKQLLSSSGDSKNINKSNISKGRTRGSHYLGEHTYNNLTVINHSSTEENLSLTCLSDNDLSIMSMLGLNKSSSIPTLQYTSNKIIDDTPLLEYEEDIKHSLNSDINLEELKLGSTSDILDSIPRINFTFHPELPEEILESHEEEKENVEEKVLDNSKKKGSRPVDLRAKKEMIHKLLAAYIEVCSNLNLSFRGLRALMFYHNKSLHKGGITIDDVDVFNALLKSNSLKRNLQKMQDMLKILDNHDIKFNLQTYIIILDCLGRNLNKHPKCVDYVKQYCQQAIKEGYTFDEMMNKGVFLNDERKAVLDSINIFDPTYKPHYENPVVQYDNELVNNLNHSDQLRSPVPISLVSNQFFSEEEMKQSVDQQVALENQMSITIKNIELKEKPTEEALNHRKILSHLYENWEKAAREAFKRDLNSLSARKGAMNNDIYLKSIPVDDFASIIVTEAKKLAEGSETYSPTINMLYKALGSKVYDRFIVLRKQQTGVLDKMLSVHKQYCVGYAAAHNQQSIENLNTRQKWQWIHHNLKNTGATLEMDHKEWVPTVLKEIGKFLYQIIIHDLKIDVSWKKQTTKKRIFQPAFYTIFRSQGRTTKEEVKPHPILAKLCRLSQPENLTFPVNEVPMICPPVPWTSVDNGGYIITNSTLVRLPMGAFSQKQRMKAMNQQQLYPAFDSLNQLSSVPWKVNTKILDVITDVFNNGGSSKLDVPAPPSSLSPPEPPQEADKSQRYMYFKQTLQHRRKKAEMYSLRCDCLYRLSLAHHFRNKIFWLPHNMDFRGRVYPIPPHLNHLGSDLARSMLIFAEPKPLGPEGLDWLKIHLINLTGLKKSDSICERLEYANECMDLIMDSADRPLDGKKWWMESDEPWQSLACCVEIAAAVRSGDPKNYKSHFPVHQDGSCNGLQHYAALGRDKAGGYSVNLCPSKKPQDVYSAVVALVEETRKKDAANGVEIAKTLEGFIKRKVIKQTIMTTVYGVTRYGARLQIAKQLEDMENFPKDLVFAASQYLTSKTLDSLRTMFTSTREIQDWFTECARLISAVTGQLVEWVTPLGLPVIQPYFRPRKLVSNSIYDSFSMDKYEKPNVMKQKNGFPPNFIHSLDSCHMMLTSLNCERSGLTFVSVHDCFWTHASTVDVMNKICREQFVALHSEPILENLSLHLTENFSYNEVDLTHDGSVTDLTKKKVNRVLQQLPATGDLDITDVLNSVYFFS